MAENEVSIGSDTYETAIKGLVLETERVGRMLVPFIQGKSLKEAMSLRTEDLPAAIQKAQNRLFKQTTSIALTYDVDPIQVNLDATKGAVQNLSDGLMKRLKNRIDQARNDQARNDQDEDEGWDTSA